MSYLVTFKIILFPTSVKSWDLNGDGRLDYSEFTSFMFRQKERLEKRKIENAKQPNDVNGKEESWDAVLYQVLKCNIIRGLIMFVVYCGLAWLVRMVEDTDQGQREEGENKYHL